ncbi:MAG: 2-oxoglutarate dehydrogenase E1 component [Bacteroidia bacterium]|nr:2-oxoglutarate dehydrogenase E1 component [Bacteroidia bacterium]
MDKLTYLGNAGAEYVEQLYRQYIDTPETLDTSWQRFFEGFEFSRSGEGVQTVSNAFSKEVHVLDLINGYRSRGHLFAKTNPILPNKPSLPTLDISNFELTEADLDTKFLSGEIIGLGMATLRQIISHLEETYCGSIGVEYRYTRNPEITAWLEKRMETSKNKPSFSKEQKKAILKKLNESASFENFLHKKFVGQKRFSLEGAESLIPALDGIILRGAENGAKEFVVGMAHRGRLNVLTNILQKDYETVFGEFEGKGIANSIFDGDVKYHMGFSSDPVLANGKQIHLSLAPNPSHLEAVNPVVEGMVRARLDNIYQGDIDAIVPILIHGDASLSGQGIVYEVAQMSELKGYGVGGTVHIVINNQIGFTTDPECSRSSTYCTDIAKVTLSPVFHVNGDDPEAVVFATQLAMDFRQEFNRDIFIDIVCYRKYGHNEGDEPRFTQALMYEIIDKHKSPLTIYQEKLIAEGVITTQEFAEMQQGFDDYLQNQLKSAKEKEGSVLGDLPKRSWVGFRYITRDEVLEIPDTSITDDQLTKYTEILSTIPASFVPHKNVAKLFSDRNKMVFETNKVDWGMGELLAYASLLADGHSIRISGQDVERGTFSHRHAVIKDQKNGSSYTALNNLATEKSKLHIYNSLLSEYAVMGFEYGYSYSSPNDLVIWEAQFGDFSNGAQIITDQFFSCSQTKWQRLNALTVLLPHGYEGQGPEHSSARMERFLQLCAENNIYVLDCTTPANMFHALRRQVKGEYRIPAAIFTPKSLLRHPKCVSPVADFMYDKFQPVIDDPTEQPEIVDRLIFCTGKIYYDLLDQKLAFNKENVAIVRLEQLYPLPELAIRDIIAKYHKAKVLWVQEEPENMGAWTYILRKLRDIPFEVCSRKESASPATGSHKQHLSQQEYIIKKALDLVPETQLVR